MLLGSSSLDDIIARLDAIERVSSQDSQILRTVKQYRKEVETRRANLQDARANQAQIVAEQAAQKQSIESTIAEQNQLLASVKDEIAEMRAEEQRRQAALAEQARARAQAAQLAQQAQADSAQQTYDTAVVETRRTTPNLPAPRYGARRRDRAPVPRRPVRLGRLEPVDRLRLLRVHMYVFAQVGVSLPHHAASQYNYGHTGALRPDRRRRPRVLQRPRPRRASTSAAASSCTRRTRATS